MARAWLIFSGTADFQKKEIGVFAILCFTPPGCFFWMPTNILTKTLKTSFDRFSRTPIVTDSQSIITTGLLAGSCVLAIEIHEHPIIQGRIGKLRTHAEHRDYKGLTAYIDRHNAYSTWEANRYVAMRATSGLHLTSRQRLKYALLDSPWLAIFYFFGSYVVKGGFLDGRAGLLFALMKSFYFLQVKGKVDELRRGSGAAQP